MATLTTSGPFMSNSTGNPSPISNATFSTTTTSPTSPTESTFTLSYSTSSSSPTGADNPRPQSDSGAIAGAAVGGSIGGLLLGFLAAFFLLRRRNRREYSTAAVTESKDRGPCLDDSLQLNQFLLDSVPDKEISGDLSSLGQLLHQHVENNYHLQPVQANSAALAQSLTSLGVGEPGFGPEAIVALALDLRTRHSAIQHVLSRILFSSIDFNSKTRLTMLPAPVAAFLQGIPPVEKYGGSVVATDIALAKWKTLSAFLLHPNRSERTPLIPSKGAITQQATVLTNAISTFLESFVAPDQTNKYKQAVHLEGVIFEFSKFGYKLFSQPSEWQFVQSAVSTQPGARLIVVCAGLNRLSGADGKRYNEPRQVVQPTVARL